MMLTALHHVQLAMPKGQEGQARRFYTDLLGLPERPKPARLSGRGGVWFEIGTLRLHLGVEEGFQPARKAHPALLCSDLDALAARLEQAQIPVRRDHDLPGFRRFYTTDPFGNRIEILEAI
ncbi:VOC family protein [Aliiroseovarius crassostreae]|uniref:VOC family protein n=2 Tax=Aliiroseovarius crassostreae TaxID=154981 RepID=UPI00220561BB|nr:VOC family protein [Aliiroseovarius crassostreae]UWP89542.1 VOC family protein [Aliiroseovarius crassostreae]UWP92680.1 VOC family protein [Aliiroseovarius crassostreae]UWP98992.1 VOC family protein [Aliiroseovarius crassostreae]